MTATIDWTDDDPDAVVDADELSDEELEPVVGGLDRIWWPDGILPPVPQTDLM